MFGGNYVCSKYAQPAIAHLFSVSVLVVGCPDHLQWFFLMIDLEFWMELVVGLQHRTRTW